MTTKHFILTLVWILSLGVIIHATTINGVPNQIISAITAHNVVLGNGTLDLNSVAPSATSGFPLLSNGTSSDPSFAQLPNAGLVNSSVTVNTSGCISGGGAVALGSTITISATNCGGWNGVTNTTPGTTPIWTLANGDASWTLNANANVTVTVTSADRWAHHTIQICQPSTGGPFSVTWPSNTKGGMTIGTTPSKCSQQMFVSYDGTNAYAVDSGVINQ